MTKREPDRKTYRKGTHRAVPPEATFARIKAFLPVFGITRIADLTGLDRVGLPVAQCVRPNARALAVSQGKGLDLISAKVSAAMESIEAYHAETMESPLFYGAFEDLRYRQKMADVDRMAQDSAGFDPRQRTMWIEVENLLGEEICLAPFEAFHADFTLPALPGSGMFLCNTNGLASGNTRQEALLHALCEVIERDAETLWHLRPDTEAQARAVNLSSDLPLESGELLSRTRAVGIEAYIWDLSSDVGLPVFQCMLLSSQEDGTDPEFGLGCHPSRDVALSRALTEALQVRLTVIAGSRDDLLACDYFPFERQARLEQAKQLCQGAGAAPLSFRQCPHFDNEFFSEDIGLVLDRLSAVGVDEVLVADLTKKAFQIPVVRAAVPGLEGPWEAFDPEAPLSLRAQRAMAGAA
jgi:ribosomal protein S12 methylthiotransferase accessory factor